MFGSGGWVKESVREFRMFSGLSKDGVWLIDSSKIGRVSSDELDRVVVDLSKHVGISVCFDITIIYR